MQKLKKKISWDTEILPSQSFQTVGNSNQAESHYSILSPFRWTYHLPSKWYQFVRGNWDSLSPKKLSFNI